MKGKILAAFFVALGIGIMTYPTLLDYYHQLQQQRIVAQWQDSLQKISDGSEEDEPNEISHDEATQAVEEQPTAPSYDVTQEMEALLIIDKINLRVPVLTGVNERNLNLAVASIENTGEPGQVGNYGIAGHRSRTYGVLFNRLDELEKGDSIVIETPDHRYIYQVTDRFIVNPEDAYVLRSNGQKKQVTLVTCDYSSKPYLRLIVQGELQ